MEKNKAQKVGGGGGKIGKVDRFKAELNLINNSKTIKSE